MPFCRFCGTKALDDSLFCGNCGKTMALPSLEQTNLSQPLPNNTQIRHNDEDNEQQRRSFPPIMPLPAQSAPAHVPMVRGTPQVGSVPSVPSVPSVAAKVTGATTKVGMAASVKLLVVATICVVVVVGSVKVVPILLKGGNHSQGSISKTGAHPIITTVPMPPTQTSCPQGGTARAAVVAPLATGSNQDIVYLENEGTHDVPQLATFKRYDVVTGKTTTITSLPKTYVDNAQISTDGRWLLFVSQVSGQAAIKMIRMDGQGLQTLYCSPVNISIFSLLWSPDEHWIAFFPQQPFTQNYIPDTTLTLVNTTNGSIVTQQLPTSSNVNAFIGYTPLAWTNSSHLFIYSSSLFLHHSIFEFYNLDISDPQHITFATIPGLQITGDWLQTDFAVNGNGTKFFASISTFGQGISKGPGTITMQSITGGPKQTIYNNSIFATGHILVASNSILFLLQNSDLDPNSTLDMSQNGIWKVNLDGSGLKRLIPINKGDDAYPSAISPDGKLYALELFNNTNNADTLTFASLSGGTPTPFTSSPNGTGLSIIGWITL